MPAPVIPRAALATALVVTAIELALLFATLSPRRLAAPHSDMSTGVERVEYVVPALPAGPTSELRAAPEGVLPSRLSARAPMSAVTPRAALAAPFGSAPTAIVPPRLAAVAPPGGSARSGGNSAIGPVLAPRGFSASSPLTRRVIDSVLDSLNAKMPALIRERVATQAERDAAYKEGVLAMRLSGRTLLVPADPHLAPGIQLPSFFSRRKQRKAARVRTDSVLAENMERLARLRARARRDSIRRDSLQRADSIRREDSLPAAMPRRLPGARTPG